MNEHRAAHLQNLIDMHRRMGDPLVMIRCDDLEEMLAAWQLNRLAKPRVRVPSRQLAIEEYRE